MGQRALQRVVSSTCADCTSNNFSMRYLYAAILLNTDMRTTLVNVTCDVTAKVFAQPFRYRVYVSNELFAERTWIWQGAYLEEMLPISAPAGIYPIRFETVDPDNGKIKVRNHQIDQGRARIVMHRDELCVEIPNEIE
jgi:hypothetical protein